MKFKVGDFVIQNRLILLIKEVPKIDANGYSESKYNCGGLAFYTAGEDYWRLATRLERILLYRSDP